MDITKKSGRIFVSDGSHEYSVDENSPAMLPNGNDAGITVGEAYDEGRLFAWDADEAGTGGAQHGALYASHE